MSVLNTAMQNLRASNPDLSKYVNRPSRYGAFEVVRQGVDEPGSIISQDLLEKARMSAGRTLQSPVWDYKDVTLGSTRTATIADDENTSQMYDVTFSILSWGFTQVPAAFMNNEIALQDDFEKKYVAGLNKVLAALDTAALTSYNTEKTQVIGDDLGYTVASNVVNASLAQANEIIGDLTPMMNSNDFYDNIKVVGNTGLLSQISKMAEYGDFNSQDRTLQFLDKEFFFTNRLANAVGKKATGYAINGASVGILTRAEREAILGTTSRTGHEWMIEFEEALQLPIDAYYYESVGDQNAIAGASTADLTRGLKRHYGFALEYAIVHAYNEDKATYATPIIKFDIADS